VAFQIRDYRPADFEQLWRIDQICFPRGIAYSRMELSAYLDRRNAVALVAEFNPEQRNPAADEQAIAGFVVAHAIRRKYGRILTLDIIPQARHYGLGTKLMVLCEERLRSLGCTEIYLETAVDNEAALRLYRKLGYQVVRTLPQYYASHALDAFQMLKRF
jgi:ribosomal-protein-alanine N-acetyltransferase